VKTDGDEQDVGRHIILGHGFLLVFRRVPAVRVRVLRVGVFDVRAGSLVTSVPMSVIVTVTVFVVVFESVSVRVKQHAFDKENHHVPERDEGVRQRIRRGRPLDARARFENVRKNVRQPGGEENTARESIHETERLIDSTRQNLGEKRRGETTEETLGENRGAHPGFIPDVFLGADFFIRVFVVTVHRVKLALWVRGATKHPEARVRKLGRIQATITVCVRSARQNFRRREHDDVLIVFLIVSVSVTGVTLLFVAAFHAFPKRLKQFVQLGRVQFIIPVPIVGLHDVRSRRSGVSRRVRRGVDAVDRAREVQRRHAEHRRQRQGVSPAPLSRDARDDARVVLGVRHPVVRRRRRHRLQFLRPRVRARRRLARANARASACAIGFLLFLES